MSIDTSEIRSLFEGLNTPAISDALDRLGLSGQCQGIAPLADYDLLTVGRAFTISYVTAGNPPGTVGDFIDDVAEGDIVVIDNHSRTDCTVWGDILTQYATAHRIGGTVIDGVCRDVSLALQQNYPLFTRGRFMRTGKDRVEVAAVNVPVTIGSARVAPRDVIAADANGVVVIACDRVSEVAAVAREIEAVEEKIRMAVAGGQTIAEARRSLGYHKLQRKE